MTPILFLDLEGVLFPTFHSRLDSVKLEPHDDFASRVKPEAMASLNRIVEDSGARVVISSNERLIMKVGDIRRHMNHIGFKGRIIGATPHMEGQNRGAEICAWIRDNTGVAPLLYRTMAILDDDPDMGPLRHKLVRTDRHKCLTQDDVAKATVLLHGKMAAEAMCAQ